MHFVFFLMVANIWIALTTHQILNFHRFSIACERHAAVMLQCSHVMAMAVQKLFPGAQVTIGPAIERGFYYDFDMPQPITEKDLKGIKQEMQRIIKADLPFVREEVSCLT